MYGVVFGYKRNRSKKYEVVFRKKEENKFLSVSDLRKALGHSRKLVAL